MKNKSWTILRMFGLRLSMAEGEFPAEEAEVTITVSRSRVIKAGSNLILRTKVSRRRSLTWGGAALADNAAAIEEMWSMTSRSEAIAGYWW